MNISHLLLRLYWLLPSNVCVDNAVCDSDMVTDSHKQANQTLSWCCVCVSRWGVSAPLYVSMCVFGGGMWMSVYVRQRV